MRSKAEESLRRRVEEFVKYLDRNKKTIVPAPIMVRSESTASVRSALWWNDSYHEKCCVTNNIPQRDGGTISPASGALTRQSTAMRACEKEKIALTGDDCARV